MARRAPTTRRRQSGGTRRTIVGEKRRDVLALDDVACAIYPSRDLKRLIVSLPHEVWLVARKDLSVQRRIPVPIAQPSVAEDLSGQLWFGGGLLYAGSSWGDQISKLGTKLSGFVDRVCLLRPGLLCGVGAAGQVLWDLESGTEAHRRKASEGDVTSLVATADERAVFTNGKSHAWMIDPNHPTGYAQLRLKETSPAAQRAEIIDRVGLTSTGRVLLAARDGATGVTHADLRIDASWFPQGDIAALRPLAVGGDAHFAYVLRPHGRVQRFCYAAPPQEDGSPGALDAFPPAETELNQAASTFCVIADPETHETSLVFCGPRAHGQLGTLWIANPSTLDWQPLKLGARQLVETPPETPTVAAPSFTATRNKIDGAPLASLSVDALLRPSMEVMLTTPKGTLHDRPHMPVAGRSLLPADTLLLPAMFRLKEGTARPGMIVWSGVVDDSEAPTPPLQFITWGNDPATGWIELTTPAIRAQRWSRAEVFPLQVAISRLPEAAPGRRAKIPRAWHDEALFSALARECQKAMKVLW